MGLKERVTKLEGGPNGPKRWRPVYVHEDDPASVAEGKRRVAEFAAEGVGAVWVVWEPSGSMPRPEAA